MTHTINKKIVSYSVVKPGEPSVAEKSPEPAPATIVQMNEKLARPEILVGSTYKIKPGGDDHAMYVTINDIVLNEGTDHEQRRPFEVFINSKNMEQFQWVVALTRIMSAVFRKGGDVTFLVEEMKAVFDPKGGYFKPGTGLYVPSVIAEIGLVIEDHMQRIGLLKKEGLSDEQRSLIASKRAQLEAKDKEASPAEGNFPATATMCPKCNQKAMVILDGCQTCLNCGNSKCG